ncbi:MAG: hypothetical protein C4617_01810 [Candidatus Liberibacter europaeus]|uniref:Uncharacterized protein n=1 Tax=Candidatus Liberibacter europaeus TaxID=744859 RepID=A0A2T4VXS9_9HYPH|nr:hypothetical protein [Candidatus Liberibacter europaeus]PTL86582.1 MAG: hypothetical protein C4617_01810 [Candidatus Liberibacter europaeus]
MNTYTKKNLKISLRALHNNLKKLIQLEQDHGRFFLFIPVFLAFGSTFWFSIANDIHWYLIIISCIITTIISLKIRYSHPNIFLIVSAMTYFLIGMTLAIVETARNSTIMLSETITANLRGRVKWRDPSTDGKWSYLVQIIETNRNYSDLILQNVLLSVTKKHDPFISGEIIEGTARLSPPSGPSLPGLFDSSFFKYYKGVSAAGFFYSIPRAYQPYYNNNWENLSLKIQSFVNELRTNIGIYIRKKIPGDVGAIAAALVTDERHAISIETTQDLQKSGLTHIIAISGLNMTIASGLFFLVMRSIFSAFPIFTESFSIKKISSFGAIITVTAYFLISGASVSAQRAYFMTVITLIAYLCDKYFIGLRGIAITAIAIICIFPSEVMGPSFQMSFATTSALIASNSIWNKRIPPHPLFVILPDKGIVLTTIVRFFKVIFLTSLIGSASASIFLIKHFHCIPIYGVVANIFAIPILSFIVIPAGLIAVFLMIFSLDKIPLYIMGWGLNEIINIAHIISNISDKFCVGRISQTLFIITIIGFLLLVILKTTIRHIGTVMIVFTTAFLFIFPSDSEPDLLVSNDGKLIAFLENNTLFSNQLHPKNFIFYQWQSALMAPIHEEPLIRKENLKTMDQYALKTIIKSIPPKKFLCINKSFCIGHSSDVVVSVLKRKDSFQLICQLSDIIITTIKGINPESCHNSLLIVPETLQKSGALEITIIPKSHKKDGHPFIIKNTIENLNLPWTRNRNKISHIPYK